MIQTEFPKSEEFLIGLQRSWKEATKVNENSKQAIKKANLTRKKRIHKD